VKFVDIMRQNGLRLVISNILLVPEMKCTLLSIGQLVHKGFTIVMGNYDKIELFDVNKKIDSKE